MRAVPFLHKPNVTILCSSYLEEDPSIYNSSTAPRSCSFYCFGKKFVIIRNPNSIAVGLEAFRNSCVQLVIHSVNKRYNFLLIGMKEGVIGVWKS